MNALRLLILLVVVLVFAGTSGWSMLVRLAYLLAGTLLLAFLWSRFVVSGLYVRRDVHGDRAQVGQTLVERFTLVNQGWLPKLWLEVRDHSTLPGREPGRVISVGVRQTTTWSVHTTCRRRGEYSLGPTTIVGADPFGLFTRRRMVAQLRRVLVYPAVVPIPSFVVPSRDLPGGMLQNRIGHLATPQVSRIREYVPGDPLGRIHWPSTARHGRLIVKEFEFDPTADVWLVLDAEGAWQRGHGDDSTEEYAVSVAASLADHFIGRGRAVGLATHAARPFFAQSDRGPRQLQKILEHLAVVRADGEIPLADVLLAEGLRLSRHATVVAVTASLDEGWVAALQLLRHRQIKTIAVLVEPSTFGGVESSLMLMSALAAADVPTVLVKRGDDLGAALSGASATAPRGGR